MISYSQPLIRNSTVAKRFNMSGRRFGRLKVLTPNGRRGHYVTWLCLCDCGNKCTVSGFNMRRGLSRSCGCLRRETAIGKNTTHGLSHIPEYFVWASMRGRCSNENDRGFKNYGGRGIKVCRRWSRFYNFIKDMGRRPSDKHSIDRINNDKGYSPKNCRWATSKEQRANQRSSVTT